MKEQITSVCLDIILAILAIPSRCLSLPSLEKSLFEKKSRIVSPSNSSAPNLDTAASAIVVFPAPESPISHNTLFTIYSPTVRRLGGLF